MRSRPPPGCSREPSDEELALLKQMRGWAERACSQNDSKARQLIAWLKEHIRPDGQWTDERVILFTEYRATQNWLAEVLASEGFTGQDRLLTMYGGMDSKAREAVKAAFQSSPEQSPVRILLATDAASEGLDLQNFCSKLVHYEIPWNPNRMEQRNGRIDRHGQKSDRVRVFHFVSKGYKERQGRAFAVPASDLEADLEFLMRVAQKVETIREDLGSVGQVLADDVEMAMLGRGYNLARTDTAERGSEPVRKMLKFERDLARQIQALLEQYRETQKELRLSPANVQKVVEVGLRLAQQPSLIPIKDPGGKPIFRLPALRGSWAAVREGLEHPHTKEIRPITFDHAAANGRDDVVLVHLNHRLVQMCLRLLRAEVWSDAGRKKMHRIEARVVPDHALPTPAVIAHARLVVIGGDSQRLHEEIITAGGYLKEGRFSRMNVGQVAEALAAATDEEPSEATKGRFLKLWGDIAPSLQQALTARMGDRSKGLEKRLLERADKEAGDIESILLELKRAIETELGDSGVPATRTVQRPGAGAVRAEQGLPAGPGEADPRRDRAGDGGDPGTVRRPAGPDVPGGGDVPGAGKIRGKMMTINRLGMPHPRDKFVAQVLIANRCDMLTRACRIRTPCHGVFPDLAMTHLTRSR